MSGASPLAPPADYPPAQHLLRDLRIFIERGADGARTLMPISPHTCTGSARVRAGVVATLVDVAGGDLALQAARPGWVATGELHVQMLRGCGAGTLVALPSVVRSGKTSVVVEVGVTPSEGGAEATPVAHATMSFSVLEARGGMQTGSPATPPGRYDFALPDSGLTRPLDERLGLRVADAERGVVELALSHYVGNSLGAFQGGGVALLLDRAAEAAARAAGHPDATTRDLSIHYLALGKVGPMRTEARWLRREADGGLLRIALVDAGATNGDREGGSGQGRLCALATAAVGAA